MVGTTRAIEIKYRRELAQLTSFKKSIAITIIVELNCIAITATTKLPTRIKG